MEIIYIRGFLLFENGDFVGYLDFDISQSDRSMEQVKQLFDKSVYPKYADKEDNINQLWDLAFELIKDKT